MEDPVVDAERVGFCRNDEKKVVDYTNFDGHHTYRFSSTSKKENESKYLCNKY